MPQTVSPRDAWRRPLSLLLQLMRRLLVGGTWLLLGMWAIGQLFRDWTLATALCFYVPSVALLFLLPVAAWWEWCAKHRRTAQILFRLTLLPALAVLLLENRWTTPAAPAGADFAWKLVHWNVCRGKLGWDAAAQILAQQEADVYILSEVPWTGQLATLIDQLPAGYDSFRFGEMAIVARGKLDNVVNQPWPRQGTMHRVRWSRDEEELSIMLVDLPSSILKARGPLLRELTERIESEKPDLVVGDFNAPRRSWRLSQLPPGYRHAYDVVGSGIGYTWPLPVPMYAIDQCILRDTITPVRYQLQSSIRSDHRLQVFYFLPRAELGREKGAMVVD